MRALLALLLLVGCAGVDQTATPDEMPIDAAGAPTVVVDDVAGAAQVAGAPSSAGTGGELVVGGTGGQAAIGGSSATGAVVIVAAAGAPVGGSAGMGGAAPAASGGSAGSPACTVTPYPPVCQSACVFSLEDCSGERAWVAKDGQRFDCVGGSCVAAHEQAVAWQKDCCG